MFCLGPFCGKFHDELEGSSDDEDDDGKQKDSIQMYGSSRKKARRIWWKRSTKKKAEETSSSTSTYMRWSQYITHYPWKVKLKRGEVTQQVMRLRVVNKQDLGPNMMNSICQLTDCHTIEIIRCDRDDIPPSLGSMESLAVLRMSHNRIRKFSDDLSKCKNIERLILDWNHISEFPQGVFTQNSFEKLEVLNLAHNKLSLLPEDFGTTKDSTQKKESQMRYMDLSYNSIQTLPDNVPKYCKSLEVLNLSHNNLKKLPEKFELKQLQRLFVSFNELKELPKTIGSCSKLAKIRIISNQIRELPESMLNLWNNKEMGYTGVLEEFMPDRNPLVMPSITTFEMAASNIDGINQAFMLFASYLEDEKTRKMQAEENRRQAKEVAKLEIAPQEAAVLLDRPTTPTASVAGGGEGGEEAARKARGIEDSAVDYYFAHCQGDLELINEIRNAESTLMLLKRNMYLEYMTRLAKEAEKKDDPFVPENLKQFLLMEDVSAYKGKILVIDLDLYMHLLVLSTKSWFSTCQLLFDKFEVGEKGFMSREEWNEFCMSVPISLSDRTQAEMWNLISWRQSDRISLVDFVAAWHIHDIHAPDPWIARVAQVLRMEYYDMDGDELRRRMRAKDANEASPELDFDAKTANVSVLDDRSEALTGNFMVRIWSASNLINADEGGAEAGVSDPYVAVRMNGLEFKTPTVMDNLNPAWDENNIFTFQIMLTGHYMEVELEVRNMNRGKDTSLGSYKHGFVPKEMTRGAWLKMRSVVLQTQCHGEEGAELTFQVRLDVSEENDAAALLKSTEGLRVVRHSNLSETRGARAQVAKADKDEGNDFDMRRPPVSLSGPQQIIYDGMLRQEYAGDEEDEAASLGSKDLSEDTGSDVSEFDAQVFMVQIAMGTKARDTQSSQKLLALDDDSWAKSKESFNSALKQLMEVPPNEFHRLKGEHQALEYSGRLTANPITRRRTRTGKTKQVTDTASRTDVFAVRQALRKVHRSMPNADFVKLINFMIRGLQLIKHSAPEQLTYWHSDDPTFRHTMGELGTNKYTRYLLVLMGFVKLSSTYWVWPCVHLDPRGERRNASHLKKPAPPPSWGDRDVPLTCPAREDKERLNDMIMLLKSCQRALHLQGAKFNGHFKTIDL